MNKRKYQKPVMQVVEIQEASIICASEVNSVNSNANFTYKGAGSGPARRSTHDTWDDDDWDN